MPRNGSGTFTLVAGNPVVSGTVVSTSWANPTLSDIAVALTGSIARDGQSAPTGNLPMAGFRHTGVGNATALTDYAAAGQVQDGSLLRCTSEANVGDAYTGLLPFGTSSFASGQTITYKFPATNTTTTPTLSLNSSPAWPIKRQDGSAVWAGDCLAGVASHLVWNDTAWLLASGSRIAAGGANTQVLFNDAGAMAGDAGLTYAKASDTLSVAGAVLTGDGTATAPAQAFISDTPLGIYRFAANVLGFAVNGAVRATLGAASFSVSSAHFLAWRDPTFTSVDTAFARNAAGVVEVNSGTAADYRDLKLRSVYAANGGAGSPVYSFTAEPTTGFFRSTAGAIDVAISGGSAYRFGGLALLPLVDNAVSCGYTGGRWSAVYAATGTINTSDIRLKKDVKESRLGLAFIESLHPVSYRWITGSNKVVQEGEGEEAKSVVTPVPGVRTHWGLIAQDVKKAVDVSGVEDFAGYVVDDMKDPDSYLSLRYDEFIAPLIKAVQELSAEVKVLKAQLAGRG